MKYSRYDKLQALKRSEAYRSDYQLYQQTKSSDDILIGDVINNRVQATVTLSPEAKKLCRKWGLRYPFDPEIELNPGGKWFTVDMSFFCGDPVSYLPDPSTWQKVRRKELRNQPESALIVEIDDKIPLLVDPMANIKETLSMVRQIIEAHREKTGSHRRDLNNKWTYYDLYLEYGSYQKVVEVVFGDDAKNKLACDSWRKQVERAVRKAAKIIEIEEEKANHRSKRTW